MSFLWVFCSVQTIVVVAEDQGVFLEGQPIKLHLVYVQMLTYPCDEEEILVLTNSTQAQGLVLGSLCHRKTLTADASLMGWGAVLDGHSARGLWTGHHLLWHINCLEMRAVFLVLKYFL